tara:strand:- start:11738 stop:12718 length:981 start_codon:yes stop_codon:yes gene_type:complete
LTQLGVKFEYQNGIVIQSDLRKGWQDENIGRPVAIREEAVLEYSALMESGSAAPAPILIATDSGLRVLDGVQRIAGADLIGTTRLSAYVVTTESEDVIATIRVLANARLQGRSEPAEWTRRRAVEILVVERSMSTAEVAVMGGWKKADITRIADAIKLQVRISNLAGPELPDRMLAVLSMHIPVDGLLEKATQPVVGFLKSVKQSQLSSADATEYIERFFRPLLKGQKPYNEFMDRLDEFKEDPEIETRLNGRSRVELPKGIALLRALKSAETITTHLLTSGEVIHNHDEYFRILNRIRDSLMSISPNRRAKTEKVNADMWSKSNE